MREKNKTDNYQGREWEELAKMGGDSNINVDKAWNKIYSRINEPGEIKTGRLLLPGNNFFRIAAAIILMLGIGLAGLYLSERSVFNKKIIVTTGINQKNLELTLPDGSVAILNRETILSYRSDYGKNERKVSLSGEAFFEITPDQNNPFTIDAGKAKVKVLGTSFNVITSNQDAAVEVFVKTGMILLSDNSGSKTLLLDSGYVGIIDSEKSARSVNENPNYMAWNTGVLVYDGQSLDIVFRDLKRVYNMEIIADDPSILKETWTSPINNQAPDTIIRLICYSFNLGYTKEGNVYHLSKK